MRRALHIHTFKDAATSNFIPPQTITDDSAALVPAQALFSIMLHYKYDINGAIYCAVRSFADPPFLPFWFAVNAKFYIVSTTQFCI